MKTILITGATSGIGYEASITLAKEGHRVVMVGRDKVKTERCVTEVQARSGSERVSYLLGDFASLKSVRQLAADFRAQYDHLDVLVNNAGAIFNEPEVTVDGIERTFATNHLAPFLLTTLLLDIVIKSAPARIVVVASGVHFRGTMDLSDLGFEKGYSLIKAYGRSKLANVLMTRSLAKRLEGKNVTVNTLHPGAVDTGIWRGTPSWAQQILSVVKPLFMISAVEGARTITYLATSPEVEGKTGLYFEKNKPRTPSKLARDEALAEQLWSRSEELVRPSA